MFELVLVCSLFTAVVDTEIVRLLDCLENKSYQTRSKAHRRLEQCGELLRPYLNKPPGMFSSSSTSPEKFNRCRLLLERLDRIWKAAAETMVDNCFKGKFPYLAGFWYEGEKSAIYYDMLDWNCTSLLSQLFKARFRGYVNEAIQKPVLESADGQPKQPFVLTSNDAPEIWVYWQQASRLYAIDMLYRKHLTLSQIREVFNYLSKIDKEMIAARRMYSGHEDEARIHFRTSRLRYFDGQAKNFRAGVSGRESGI
jgi:hypothetical protein